MARGRQTFSTRISLTGGAEVRQTLDNIGQTGQRQFRNLRQSAQQTQKAGQQLSGQVRSLGDRFRELRQRTQATREQLQRVNAAEPGLRRLHGTMRRLVGVFAGIFAARNLASMTTEWAFLQDRIGAVVDETIEVSEAMERLTQISNQVGESTQQVAREFANQATILADMGLNTREQLDLTEAIALALADSGLHGQDAARAQEQLTRAMVRGNLESRQLREILESSSTVVAILSERLGFGAQRIREMGEAGEITGQVLAEALLDNLDRLRSEAEGAAITIGDAWTVLQNNFFQFIGTADEASGASRLVAGAILTIARNMDIVIPALATFGALWAAVQLGTLVSQILSMASAMITLGVGIASASAPLILLVVSITALVGLVAHFTGLLDPLYEKLGLVSDTADEGSETVNRLGAAFDGAATRSEAMGERVEGSSERIRDAAARSAEETETHWLISSQATADHWDRTVAAISEMFTSLESRVVSVIQRIGSALSGLISMAADAARAVAGIGNSGSGGAQGGGVGLKSGGKVTGPGTSSSDSIFAAPRYWLSNGEFIIPANRVRQYGLGFMEAIRRGRLAIDGMKGFAQGGLVEGIERSFAPPSLGALANIETGNGISGRPLSLTIGVETFEGLIAPETVAERLTRFATGKSARQLSKAPRWYQG